VINIFIESRLQDRLFNWFAGQSYCQTGRAEIIPLGDFFI